MIHSLSSQVLWTVAAIVLMLAVVTAALQAWRYIRPHQPLNEIVLRVRTWWIIIGLFSLALIVGRTASVVFFACVSFLALKEYFTLIPTRRSDRRVLLWAYLSIPFQYMFVHKELYGMFYVFIPVYLFLWLPTRMVALGETKGFLQAIGTIHWGVMTTVFCLSHAAFLLTFAPGSSPRMTVQWPTSAEALSAGPALLLLLVVLTEFNDVAQFCWGKCIGKRKIVSGISPGKTVAGFVGGAASTIVLAGAIGPMLTILNLQSSLIAGAIVGFSGFAGDVTISAIKRDLGVKDSGSALPGHGGILDRVDSLTYTAPLFFHFIFYLYG